MARGLRELGDEELGKRDDDHNRANGKGGKGARIPAGPNIRALFQLRRRRIIQWIVVLSAFYLLFKNMPEGQQLRSGGRPTYSPMANPGPQSGASGDNKMPATDSRSDSKPLRPDPKHPIASEHYFDGPVKFPALPSTLHSLGRFGGHKAVNKNILFAAASLRSLAILLPIACEMARWRRSHVHFVMGGRDELPFNDILDTNGIKSDCGVIWHDARPDQSTYSTESRMKLSVGFALNSIEEFMHPQAYIVDNSGDEDDFLLGGVRSKSKELGKTTIELPYNAQEVLSWITRLDSGSLQAWHKADMEIVIQAPQESSGSLIRLLDSLQAANYASSRPPRLTIELPPTISKPLKDYLAFMQWPPVQYQPDSNYHISQLTLRHRIPSHPQNAAEASLRVVESFFPARPQVSHLIMLSPQIQLSPLWFLYCKYALLEYRYAAYHFQDTHSIMGLSLSIPATHLNHSSTFDPPPISEEYLLPANQYDTQTQFLYQAPNSGAALYFGDKWREFHSFLSHRLEAKPTVTRPKQVSSEEPAWMEYLLELMRARGYSMIYPGWTSGMIAVLHKELTQPPEEFAGESKPVAKSPPPKEAELSSPTSLLSILPRDGDLPELPIMPWLNHEGQLVELDSEWSKATQAYIDVFREEVGGCRNPKTHGKMEEDGARDLFCIEGEEMVTDSEPLSDLPASTSDEEPLISSSPLPMIDIENLNTTKKSSHVH